MADGDFGITEIDLARAQATAGGLTPAGLNPVDRPRGVQLENQTVVEFAYANAAFLEFAHSTYVDSNGVVRTFAQLYNMVQKDEFGRPSAETVAQIFDQLEPVYVDGKLRRGAADYFSFVNAINDNEERKQEFFGADGGDGVAQANRIASTLANIRDRAARMGLQFTEDELREIATIAVTSDWNNAQIVDRLLLNFDFSKTVEGDLQATDFGLRQSASEYLLNLTDDQFADYSRRIAGGELTAESVNNLFAQKAMAEMPWLENYLQRGLKPYDIFGSNITYVANELELDTDMIDLTQPEWRDMMISTDESGNQRLATQNELKQRVRERPEWAFTESAQSSTQQLAVAVANIFGRGGF